MKIRHLEIMQQQTAWPASIISSAALPHLICYPQWVIASQYLLPK
jgi:hypothetical protein